MPRSRPIRALEGRRLLRWDARLCISIGSGLCFDAAGPEGGRLRDFVQLSLGVAGVAVQSGACCVNDAGGPKATATGARPTLRRARHRREAVPANHVRQRWGLVRIYNKREGEGWGNGRESPRGGRRALLSEPYITSTVGVSRP